MTGHPRDRSQSGLDRLLVFVVLAIALVFVAPLVLGVVGVDVRPDETDRTAPAEHDLSVLAARGEAVDTRDGSVGAVRLVVSPEPGRAPVDLREGTAIWIGEETLDLVPLGPDAEGADGRYAVAAESGGEPVLRTVTARGVLRFDIGTDDVQDLPEFGQRLEAGESATIVLVTPRGETLSRQVTVPTTVRDGAANVGL